MNTLETRVSLLETELRHEKEERQRERDECAADIKEVKDELAKVQEKLTYYDRAALKWGTAGMTVLTLGSLAAMTVDKAKEKLLSWLGL